MLYPQKQNKKSMLLGCYAGQDAVHETHFGTKCCAKHGLLPDPPKWIHHMLTCKWHQHAGAFICTCSQQTSMLRLQLDAAASTCQDSSLSQDPEQQLDNPAPQHNTAQTLGRVNVQQPKNSVVFITVMRTECSVPQKGNAKSNTCLTDSGHIHLSHLYHISVGCTHTVCDATPQGWPAMQQPLSKRLAYSRDTSERPHSHTHCNSSWQQRCSIALQHSHPTD